MDDSKKFLIVDIVVLLGRLKGLGIKCDGMPAVKEVWLFKNGPESEVASVCDESEWEGTIWEQKDRGCDEFIDKLAKRSFVVGKPFEGGVFFRKLE